MNRRDFLLSSAAFLLTTQTLLSINLPVQASGSKVVIVLSSDETGAPHLDPIRATLISVAADCDVRSAYISSASCRILAGKRRRHELDIPAEKECPFP